MNKAEGQIRKVSVDEVVNRFFASIAEEEDIRKAKVATVNVEHQGKQYSFHFGGDAEYFLKAEGVKFRQLSKQGLPAVAKLLMAYGHTIATSDEIDVNGKFLIFCATYKELGMEPAEFENLWQRSHRDKPSTAKHYWEDIFTKEIDRLNSR